MISPNYWSLGAIGLAFSVLLSQLCETITVVIISKRIINQVKGINRVLYDFTSKPPGTIEWE